MGFLGEAEAVWFGVEVELGAGVGVTVGENDEIGVGLNGVFAGIVTVCVGLQLLV